MDPLSIDTACPFCSGGQAALVGDRQSGTLYVECMRCLARGPAILSTRPDAQAQVLAAWTAGKKFGRIAIANVPSGMPAFTCSMAERFRLLAESLYKGDYGEVESVVIMMRIGKNVTTITHNISNSDVIRVLDAVRESTRIRAATIIPTVVGQSANKYESNTVGDK